MPTAFTYVRKVVVSVVIKHELNSHSPSWQALLNGIRFLKILKQFRGGSVLKKRNQFAEKPLILRGYAFLTVFQGIWLPFYFMPSLEVLNICVSKAIMWMISAVDSL